MGESAAGSPVGAARPGATIALTVHGQAGALDLLVPDGATAIDVAREYAAEAGVGGVPILHTATGAAIPADRPLADVGIVSGDVVVATAGIRKTRSAERPRPARSAAERHRGAVLWCAAAAVAAGLAGWYGAHATSETVRVLVAGLLVVTALLAALPVAGESSARASAAPSFAAAAGFVVVWTPGQAALPGVVAASALSAAVVAAVGRALDSRGNPVLGVWMVAGLVLFVVCGTTPFFEVEPRVVWAVLLVLAFLAARFVPSFAVDVPDQALLDLERLAINAWSARDQATGKRGRVVVSGEAMAALVARASATVTAACAAILVTVWVAAPLLLATATISLDRIGARALVALAGSALLLTARSYRHSAARGLLMAAGAWCLLVIVVAELPRLTDGASAAVLAAAGLLGLVCVLVAVALGRGWRSVWWARRAEMAEVLCGAFGLAAAVVASGLFRSVWEMTV